MLQHFRKQVTKDCRLPSENNDLQLQDLNPRESSEVQYVDCLTVTGHPESVQAVQVGGAGRDWEILPQE
ncbi:unnamed protein product [Fasciola hepatica]|uniref:Uncharacterized protein n=1 Tax=Fasciola hepatica TaxID=6192 RepID=A0ABC9HIS9_FASHE